MKEIIQKLWMVMAILYMTIPALAYDFEVDGIAYNVTSFTDLTCEVAKGGTYIGEVTIPSEVLYNGKRLTVTSIEKDCFYKCTDLRSIAIPNTVKELGSFCFFGCRSLEKITLPENLSSIGANEWNPYYSCGCFNGCISLKQIDLPLTLKSIGAMTFAYCKSLTSITLPENLERIGPGCFKFCTSLTSQIRIPHNITEWPIELFYNCSSIEIVNVPEGTIRLGDSCFMGCEKLVNITLPSTLKEVGEDCFAGTAINNINLNNLTFIPGGLFRDCKNLHNLDISDSIEYIELAILDWSYSPASQTRVYNLTFGGTTIERLTIKGIDYSSSIPVGLKHNEKWYGEIRRNWSGITQDQFDSSWCGSLKYLKMQRPIDVKLINCLSLEVLDLDFEVENLDNILVQKISELPELTCLMLSGKVPPIVSSKSFTSQQYMNLRVVVPDDAVEVYKNTDMWKNFWNITSKSEHEAGVEKILSDGKTELARYDLMGNPITTNYHGIVIIKYSDGTSSKRFISQ